MYLFVATNFLAILRHPHAGSILTHAVLPGVQGGFNSTSMLLIIAIVGTTIAPWQLFFQQSNVIDKRITPRWINYERADTVIGSVIVILGAAALVIAAAFAFAGTPLHGQFADAGAVATGFAQRLGSAAGAIFALVLLNAAIIGAAAVTLSSSYAFGDVFGRRHSLHHRVRDAKAFHGSFAALVALAAAIVLIPGAPLGTLTTAVQALAGVLLPSATVFLVLLCNDKAVLGPWTNPPWLNAIAATIIGVLVATSAILTATTLFPKLDVTLLAEVVFGVLTIGLAAAGIYSRAGRRQPDASPRNREARDDWTMPPLELLARPEWSRIRTVGMYALRGYLVLAVVMLIVKAIEVGIGH